jgi:exonuclease SbcD
LRILHTSDWHLGKTLEGFSRLEEQEKFIDEFVGIVRERNVDLVIIAGDIYDTGNPPAKAENLFYRALKEITGDGKRGVIVVSGNHDSPERLVAAAPLALEMGIILFGTPKSCVITGRYGCMDVVDSGDGYVEIELHGEKAVIITLPYPSEKRLNELFIEEFSDEGLQKSYSEKVGELFAKLSEKYRDDTINIAVSHLFITGGLTCESERPIEVGGSYAISADRLPEKAQYIALGHLHRPQSINYNDLDIRYSGSPIQYSKSEVGYSKCAYIVDVRAGEKAHIEEVMFNNYKPIEVWKCSNVEDAIEKCRKEGGRNIWVYIEVKTDRVISQSEMKEMRDLCPNIIEIKPEFKGQGFEESGMEDISEKSMRELFIEFYRSKNQVEPSDELTNLFLKITQEGGDEDEAEEA